MLSKSERSEPQATAVALGGVGAVQIRITYHGKVLWFSLG